MSSKRPRWPSTCYHPLLIGSAIFISILYVIFPSAFVLLAKSFPIALCTALLLGILLIHGESSKPRAKEDGGRDVRSDIMIKNQDDVRHAVNRRKDDGEGVKEWRAVMPLAERNNVAQKLSASCEASGCLLDETKDTCHATADENGSTGSNHDFCFGSTNFISSRHDAVHRRDVSADSENDDEESSAASDADLLTLLDELDPLLDPEAALATGSNSDASSQDDDIILEETGIQDDEDEDDDETHEEKEDESKDVVTWTADDQSNLVHLGNSELERNIRLERLMERRRSMKIPPYRAEKNLIDLDGFDTLLRTEEITRPNAQLSSIYAPTKNPFDLPYDTDDSIPGSAPSVLLQRQNPFHQLEQTDMVATGDLGLIAPTRDALFRRHESFAVGPSLFGDPDQDRFAHRLKPYFSTVMGEDAGIFPDIHRQLSDMSDSKVSSTAESDTASSGTDQEHTEVARQEREWNANFIAESIDGASFQSDIEHVVNGTSVDGDHETHANNDMTSVGQTHQYAQVLGGTEDDDTSEEEQEVDPIVSDAENAQALDEDIESRTPSPSKTGDTSPASRTEQQTDLKDQMDNAFSHDSDDSAKDDNAFSHDSAKEVEEGYENMNEAEQIPVYDSSPSATEKSKSIFSTESEEILLPADRGDLTPDNSSPIHTEESNSAVLRTVGQEDLRIVTEKDSTI